MAEYMTDEEMIHIFNQIFENRQTVADMKSLKPEFVQKVYFSFLKDFGANLENINQLPFDVPESVQQHPDLFMQAARIMTLAKVVGFFFKSIYNDESFMPADLFDPKPKRTRRFFQKIVEFYFEANNFCEEFSNIEEKVQLKVEGRQKMLQSKDEMIRKISELRQQNTKFQIQEDEMHKRITAAQQELSEKHVIKQSLKNQMENLKLESSNTATAINDAKLQIIEGKERVASLCGQVVQESEKQDIEERERQLTSHREMNSQKLTRLDELKKSMKTVNTANDLMKDSLLPLLKEIKEAKDQESEISNFINQMEREKAANLEEVEDIQMKCQQFQEQLVSRQERISQMNLAWTVKKESLQDEINQNKLTLEGIRRTQSEDEIAAQDLETQRIQAEKETAAIEEQIAHFDIFVATKYQAVLKAIETQNSDLEVYLSELSTTVNKCKGNL